MWLLDFPESELLANTQREKFTRAPQTLRLSPLKPRWPNLLPISGGSAPTDPCWGSVLTAGPGLLPVGLSGGIFGSPPCCLSCCPTGFILSLGGHRSVPGKAETGRGGAQRDGRVVLKVEAPITCCSPSITLFQGVFVDFRCWKIKRRRP